MIVAGSLRDVPGDQPVGALWIGEATDQTEVKNSFWDDHSESMAYSHRYASIAARTILARTLSRLESSVSKIPLPG